MNGVAEIVSLEGQPPEAQALAELHAEAWWARELVGSEAFAAMLDHLEQKAAQLEQRLVKAGVFDQQRAEDQARGQIAGMRYAQGLADRQLAKLAKAAEKERAARAAG